MDEFNITRAIHRLRQKVKHWRIPVVTLISHERDPFRVLISCLLSLRTRDEVTGAASDRLFGLADTPEKILSLKPGALEKAIYPVAFYRNKTRTLRGICQALIENHQGKVPDKLETLLELKGVGRKTANLTLTLGFGKMGICVDTHVHRIANRWGYVKTGSADETERALREKLPKRYWKEFNDLLVTFGQNCCKPVSPICGECCLGADCPKVGVKKHR